MIIYYVSPYDDGDDDDDDYTITVASTMTKRCFTKQRKPSRRKEHFIPEVDTGSVDQFRSRPKLRALKKDRQLLPLGTSAHRTHLRVT